MNTASRRSFRGAIMALALGWAVTGCSSTEPSGGGGGGGGGGNSAVVGTWNATSFVDTGSAFDLVGAGMSLTMTLTSGGTYTLSITNDQGLCDVGQTSCSETGSYTATGSQINFDDGGGGFTMNYAIIGNEMSVSGTIDGQSFTGMFVKQ